MLRSQRRKRQLLNCANRASASKPRAEGAQAGSAGDDIAKPCLNWRLKHLLPKASKARPDLKRAPRVMRQNWNMQAKIACLCLNRKQNHWSPRCGNRGCFEAAFPSRLASNWIRRRYRPPASTGNKITGCRGAEIAARFEAAFQERSTSNWIRRRYRLRPGTEGRSAGCSTT